jgi:hypothetical protein
MVLKKSFPWGCLNQIDFIIIFIHQSTACSVVSASFKLIEGMGSFAALCW